MPKFVRKQSNLKPLKNIQLAAIALIFFSSCMVLDGGNAYRKSNKCCGVIKCDMHRRSQVKKHKRTVNAHKSLKKKENRIKNGY